MRRSRLMMKHETSRLLWGIGEIMDKRRRQNFKKKGGGGGRNKIKTGIVNIFQIHLL